MREFDELVEIMRRLRGPDGCPWDRQQDHRSMRGFFVEEVCEALEALDDEDWPRFCAELGDVMLQVVFHAQLAAEAGHFDIRDALRVINDKLRRRHPHVFGDLEVESAEEVLVNWEHIKRGEPGEERRSVLDGVPKGLPALQRAADVQRRAARVGFDWPEIAPVWEKVQEELGELGAAAETGDAREIEAELGDLLFAVVNLARFLKVDPEQALRGAVRRFEERFRTVERQAAEQGRDLCSMGLAEMDELWEAAKESEQRRQA
ncbi:MAG: nucleoside triphosphate pyrophosphohydrolase [Armatimonadetes bacterium]|nr:nucleoside triphosphate pyrophosphohydrolase [Armatimonadota bacterium]